MKKYSKLSIFFDCILRNNGVAIIVIVVYNWIYFTDSLEVILLVSVLNCLLLYLVLSKAIKSISKKNYLIFLKSKREKILDEIIERDKAFKNFFISLKRIEFLFKKEMITNEGIEIMERFKIKIQDLYKETKDDLIEEEKFEDIIAHSKIFINITNQFNKKVNESLKQICQINAGIGQMMTLNQDEIFEIVKFIKKQKGIGENNYHEITKRLEIMQP